MTAPPNTGNVLPECAYMDVLTYPVGAFDRTCYDYEPWHYRYVGRDLAAQIVADGRTPREVLWERQ